MLRHVFAAALLTTLAITPLRSVAQAPADSAPKLLNATEAGAILPPSVFFRGQSATIQARNSGGVQFSKDALLLAALVDTSGYSSAVQQKYQAYLITESAIDIGDHRLAPGAYGFGFIANDQFIVMDIGGHDLFTRKSTHDANLRRPMPLQVLPAPSGHSWRLYAGRSFVEFALAPSAAR
ncbi:hypothetical protein [Edaphobacter aggregans]|uniref:hypothetical protein n=1 Tax=Edaphobacter aggregans TaxID=570835 RepID=UPI00055073F1|nr:hypothetical protein [Edaphobacter aggregans]